MQKLHKGYKILTEQGAGELFKQLYNHYIAALLPSICAQYNGVETFGAKLFDNYISWRKKNKPSYESGLVDSLIQNVDSSDHVVIVGGGWGVTAVRSAQVVGSDGKVSVFEGSESQIAKVNSTIELNGVSDRVDINHAVVGPNIGVYGNTGDAEIVSPSDLPKCDVLELDCEGSELEILQNLELRPRVIIVESHGRYNSSTKDVIDTLNDLNYHIKSVSLAEISEHCIQHDIRVITGLHNV